MNMLSEKSDMIMIRRCDVIDETMLGMLTKLMLITINNHDKTVTGNDDVDENNFTRHGDVDDVDVDDHGKVLI